MAVFLRFLKKGSGRSTARTPALPKATYHDTLDVSRLVSSDGPQTQRIFSKVGTSKSSNRPLGNFRIVFEVIKYLLKIRKYM
jgi:hypothetical protein